MVQTYLWHFFKLRGPFPKNVHAPYLGNPAWIGNGKRGASVMADLAIGRTLAAALLPISISGQAANWHARLSI
jgi:hypothetical protein